jgi:hypothetical protein
MVVHREVSAVSALIEVFGQLTFTPYALYPRNIQLALRVYDMLLNVVSHAKSTRARITALQFLVRLRVDRDHRLYFVSDAYDPNGMVFYLAELVHRTQSGQPRSDTDGSSSKPDPDDFEIRKARPRVPHETLRGRAGGPSHSTASRSRSRTMAPPTLPKTSDPLWQIPETLPFFVAGADSPSEVLVSYDHESARIRSARLSLLTNCQRHFCHREQLGSSFIPPLSSTRPVGKQASVLWPELSSTYFKDAYDPLHRNFEGEPCRDHRLLAPRSQDTRRPWTCIPDLICLGWLQEMLRSTFSPCSGGGLSKRFGRSITNNQVLFASSVSIGVRAAAIHDEMFIKNP